MHKVLEWTFSLIKTLQENMVPIIRFNDIQGCDTVPSPVSLLHVGMYSRKRTSGSQGLR